MMMMNLLSSIQKIQRTHHPPLTSSSSTSSSIPVPVKPTNCWDNSKEENNINTSSSSPQAASCTRKLVTQHTYLTEVMTPRRDSCSSSHHHQYQSPALISNNLLADPAITESTKFSCTASSAYSACGTSLHNGEAYNYYNSSPYYNDNGGGESFRSRIATATGQYYEEKEEEEEEEVRGGGLLRGCCEGAATSAPRRRRSLLKKKKKSQQTSSSSSSPNNNNNNSHARRRSPFKLMERLSLLSNLCKSNTTPTTRTRHHNRNHPRQQQQQPPPPLTEFQLRKRVRKHAQRSDWDSVRALIANYEFSDIPPIEQTKKRDSFCFSVNNDNGDNNAHALLPRRRSSARRPSVEVVAGGSVGLLQTATQRRSFTSVESGLRRSLTQSSAAAAAVIRAAMLLEDDEDSDNECCCSPSLNGISNTNNTALLPATVYGDNILHDVCVHRPPIDVIETLLKGLRHRRGATRGITATTAAANADDAPHNNGRRGRGRTPLHLAAESGACPQVISALVRADPAPASVGDADGRCPLHLAVRHFAKMGDGHVVSTEGTLVNQACGGGGSGGGAQDKKQKKKKKKKAKMMMMKKRKKHHSPPAAAISREESIQRTLQTVRILKDAMLTYPGKVDFKDEDDTGYSPLDYALDSSSNNFEEEEENNNSNKEYLELLQALIRRKEPKAEVRRRRSSGQTLRSNPNHRNNMPIMIRRLTTQTSISDDCQDMKVLLQLEHDEVMARRARISLMKKEEEEKKKKTTNVRELSLQDALFDMFGIEGRGKQRGNLLPKEEDGSVASFVAQSHEEEEEPSLQFSTQPASTHLEEEETDEPTTTPEETKVPQEEEETEAAMTRRMTDAAIYNHHLQNFLNDFMDNNDYYNGDDDDDFDILEDPSEARLLQEEEEEEAAAQRILQERKNMPAPTKDDEDDVPSFPTEIIFGIHDVDDDDCDSVVSEITVR